ncbi:MULTISPECIES: hypothetical protein [unclassified Cupriavidus]|uniref:hypothetical protein n=1 Tax=Cupriavidus sp. H19C3 TaxID=3241603 RepID=UPI0011D7AB78|nr:MAG: hypothetical protein E6Q40_14955 [Cupriavidus sp.]
MKVKQNRHGQTLRRARRARVAAIAGLVMACALMPQAAEAQSAGMANLLHHRGPASDGRAVPPGRDRPDPRETRGRPDRYRNERDMAERATRQGPGGGNPRLSPDERKALRKNLLDLSREMYEGG